MTLSKYPARDLRRCRCGHRWSGHYQSGGSDLITCDACPAGESACEDYNEIGSSEYAAAPAGGKEWDRRGPGPADAIDLSEFEVGPREVICAKCWLVHRPTVDCEA